MDVSSLYQPVGSVPPPDEVDNNGSGLPPATRGLALPRVSTRCCQSVEMSHFNLWKSITVRLKG